MFFLHVKPKHTINKNRSTVLAEIFLEHTIINQFFWQLSVCKCVQNGHFIPFYVAALAARLVKDEP